MKKNFLIQNLLLFLFIFFVHMVHGQGYDSTNTFTNAHFYKRFDSLNKELVIDYDQKKMIFIKSKPLGFIKHLPKDLWLISKSPFKKEYLAGVGLTVFSTIALVPFDQQLMEGVQKASKALDISNQSSYGILLNVGDTKIFKYPRNINSALYQLGEGGTSMFLAAGLWIFGKVKKDYRALQTAYDLAETFIAMGVTTQILKRISGRESPFVATKPGGRWRPFPSFGGYQESTPKYDAFPSGHLATMMASVTVLTNNYPEKKWIQPVGYSVIGLTALAMMNTEVHWISDYPLALALGYISGKITTMRHEKLHTPKTVQF